MQLSDLRSRDILVGRRPTLRADESLVFDRRSGMRPVDCIDRKLGLLLSDETMAARGQFPRGVSVGPNS